MKVAFVLLVAFCYVECRKLPPIDKNANIAFINNEGGGAARPVPKLAPLPEPAKPVAANQAPKPAVAPAQTPKPAVVSVAPAKPVVPSKPVQNQANQAKPIPVNPTPAAHPVSTPGPGSVKQLVTFYDSQGKASVIRPYSYSQAVKQG